MFIFTFTCFCVAYMMYGAGLYGTEQHARCVCCMQTRQSYRLLFRYHH
jgi:hypothetical protein